MTWTDDRVEKLKQLWAAGHSGGEIVKALGGVFSRNAVIGKVHRLGLPTRMKKKPRKDVTKKPSISATGSTRLRTTRSVSEIIARTTVPIKPLPKGTDVPQSNAYPIVCGIPHAIASHEGDERCRFPIGNPEHADFHFCTNAAMAGKRYCEGHCAAAYYTPSTTDWLEARREWAMKNPEERLAKQILRKLAEREVA